MPSATNELVVRNGTVRRGGSVSFRTILNGAGVFGFRVNGRNGFDPTLTVRVGGRTFFDDDGGPGLNSFLSIRTFSRATANITVRGFAGQGGRFTFIGTP